MFALRRRTRRERIQHVAQRPRPEIVVAPRVEHAMAALAGYTQQLEQRLDRLERRLDEATTQTDRQVATDLTRLALAMGAELEEIKARLAAPAPSPEPEPDPDVEDAEMLDRLDAARTAWPLTAS